MIIDIRTLLVSLLAAGFITSCGSGSNSSAESVETPVIIPTNQKEDYLGTWLRSCYEDGVFRSNMLVANEDDTVISTDMEFSDSECNVNTATVTRTWDITLLDNASTTDLGNAQFMNIDITSEDVVGMPTAITGTVGITIYTLILQVESNLYFATNPSFTADGRPDDISVDRIWVRQ